MMANKSSSKKTMDVAKPGESAPDISARPILVTHRPMVQDPMFKEDKKAEDAVVAAVEPKTGPTTHGEKVIQPAGEQAKREMPTETQANEEALVKEEVKTEPEDGQAKPEKTKEKTQAEEAAVVEAVADQATEDKRKQNKLSDEEKAKQEALQKLIAEKKYFVPIGQIGRRNRRALLVAAALTVLLIGGYLAIDAQLIKTTLKLPFDLIKN